MLDRGVKMTTETRNEESLARRCFPYVLALLLGAAVWFGVQAASGLDNFSDDVNPAYFIALYSAGFILGLVTRFKAIRAGFALSISQVLYYIVYPNVDWELGNLFPIAAGFLFVFTLPAIGAAYVASVLRAKTVRS